MKKQVLVYDISAIPNGTVKPDSNVGLVIFEGFLGRTTKLTTSLIKEWFPNCKIIAVGSHTLNCHGHLEYNSPFEVDLHLDTSPIIVNEYRNRGITSELFVWSAAKSVIDYISSFVNHEKVNYSHKDSDIICLVNSGSQIRRSMIGYLRSKGLKCLSDLKLPHIDDVSGAYIRSWISLGTTSPGCDVDRNGKGFRDWIAPFLNVVLIHDDFLSYYSQNNLFDSYDDVVPMYEYKNYDEIIDLVKCIKKDRNLYERLLISQRNCSLNNTLEKQIYKAIKNHSMFTPIWL